MKTAFTNSIAVVDYKVRSFLLFFSDKSVLKAFFFTPKTYWRLSPTHSLPLISRPWESLRTFLSSSRLSVNIETKEFNCTGSLLGGGACCAKGSALEQESLKPNKWTPKLQAVSSCTDNTQVELLVTELDTALLDPKFEEFRDVLTEVNKVQWKNSYAKTSVIEALLKAAEKLYATGSKASVQATKPLCERVQAEVSNLRDHLLIDSIEDVYPSTSLDFISSAFEKLSSLDPSAPNPPSLTTHDLALEDETYSGSLIASAVTLRTALETFQERESLDKLLHSLETCPWQVQVLTAHHLRSFFGKFGEKDQERLVDTELTVYLLFNTGPNSWKVRGTAVQTVAFLLNDESLSTDIKGQISYLALKALDTESHEGVRTALKHLPRSYLDPPLLCTSLPGDGQGGIYKLHTGDLKPFSHELLHGTARVTPTLKGSIVITGGIFNPKKCFEIDLQSSEVRELPTLREERYWHAACLVGHEILVCGGRSTPDEAPLRSAEKLLGDKWVKLPDMICRRESHACAEREMRVYAVGGLGDEAALTSIEVLEHNSWRKVDIALPVMLLVPGVIAVSSEQLVIAGGKSEETQSDAFEVNLKDLSIKKLPPLPHPAAFSGNSAEVYGANLVFLSSEAREIFLYNNEQETWSTREY